MQFAAFGFATYYILAVLIVEFSVQAFMQIFIFIWRPFMKKAFFISAWGTIIQMLSQDINIFLQNRNKCDILCDRTSRERAIKCKLCGQKGMKRQNRIIYNAYFFWFKNKVSPRSSPLAYLNFPRFPSREKNLKFYIFL